MKIKILGGVDGYKEMLRKDPSQRKDYLESVLLKDFIPMFKKINMPMAQLFSTLLPSTESDKTYRAYLDLMDQAGIEAKCLHALEQAISKCKKHGIALPDHLTFGIYLGDPQALAHSEGYTGFGGIPGYIQMIISPTPDNLKKLPAAVCHEFHHNCMFLLKPFNFMTVSLKEYILYEGLAENFAEEICGENMIGPWVTNVSDRDLELSKCLIEPVLNIQGFQTVTPYLFGGQSVLDSEGNSIVMPATGGYAVGYHIVKAYRKATGQSTLDAMTKSPDEIIDISGYFKR